MTTGPKTALLGGKNKTPLKDLVLKNKGANPKKREGERLPCVFPNQTYHDL